MAMNLADLKTVKYEVHERVALITLNRPQRMNAWTGRMHFEYRWCLEQADNDQAVRAIVVTGAERAFCVGADSQALSGHSERGSYDSGLPDEVPSPGADVYEAFDADFAYHFGLSKPIIAAINGPAAGVGLVLACYCDLRFAAPEVKLTTAHGKLNIPAEYGLSWLLPRLIGVSRAMDVLLSSRVIFTEEAHEWGLVNQIHDRDDLVNSTLTYASDLASNISRGSLRETRRQVWLDQHRSVSESVNWAGGLMSEMMSQADYQRGVEALVNKRAPDFQ